MAKRFNVLPGNVKQLPKCFQYIRSPGITPHSPAGKNSREPRQLSS